MAVLIPFGNILMKNAPVVMMRLAGPDGNPLVQAQISQIRYQVWNITTRAKILDTQTLVVSDVIFNSPQNDDLWNGFDEIGYNFKHAFVDGSSVFLTKDVFQIDYKFTMAITAAIYRAAAQLKAQEIFMDV